MEKAVATAKAWTPDQPIVGIGDVHKSFGDTDVLKGISFDVMKGEVICIIGPSGSGKSTLLRCINALVPINSGSITVEGLEVHDPARSEEHTSALQSLMRNSSAVCCLKTKK